MEICMKKVVAARVAFLIAGGVIALSIAGPELLTKIQDKAMLGEIHSIVAGEEGEGFRYTLSPGEKLYILSSGLSSIRIPESEPYTRTYSFVANRTGQTEEASSREQAFTACNEELAKLKKLGILPEEIQPVSREEYDAALYSAIDVLEPRNYVGVWNISLSNSYENRSKENRLIDAYLGAEDGRLYEFYVRTSLTWEEISPDAIVKAWAGYMELGEPILYENANPLMEATPYFKKYIFPGAEQEETIVTVGFYEGINELFLKISQ